MRLTVILLFVSVVCGLVYFIFSHPGLDRLERLERELRGLEAQNEALQEQNETLEQQILALRDDPRLAERRARESVGLARPDELIFQFDEQSSQQAVRVRLRVEKDQMVLAGEAVVIEELEGALKALHDELPQAILDVQIGDELSPIERQRVLDIVDASAMESVRNEEG